MIRIGSPAMNLLTAPLTEAGARLAVANIPLSPGIRSAAGRDKLTELVVGIRPEHLHLTSAAPAAGADPELTGEVLLVEELGADALLHVRLADDGDPVVRNTVVARTEGRKPPAPGQRVAFRVQPDDVFAFHPRTGARLAA